MDNTKKLISMQEVSKHNTEGDCWVVIHNKVYDLTSFLPEHPGGEAVILGYAGRDATPGFEPIHPPDIIKILPKSAYKGEIDPATVVPSNDEKSAKQASASEPQPTLFSSKLVQRSPQPYGGVKPPIEHMLNVFDLERVAQSFMKKEAWDYYSSGADDEVTLRENHNAFHRIWMKPRVMVNVSSIDTSCSLLGSPSSFPVYITATALAKLGHPDGEVGLTRAAHSENVIQMCPTLASCSLDEMIAARQPGQTQWFQLYVNQNRKVTAELVKRAEQGGMKGLFITVDAPQLGKREKDQRNKFSFSAPDVQQKIQQKVKRNQGTARAISAFIDPSLNWDDIKWFQSITSMPIVLKGIQCGEDAIMAARMGIQGIVVSNHGGRQLDFSRSGIEVLPEVMAALRSIGAENKIEVYVDGGVRRGTDIFKALALGAKGVGIGRPVLYGLSAYGQEGVEKVIQILKDELEVCMRLMGTPTIADIRPEMVCTRSLSDHFAVVPKDYLSAHSYIPLSRL